MKSINQSILHLQNHIRFYGNTDDCIEALKLLRKIDKENEDNDPY